MSSTLPHLLIAGATGYLGRHLCAEYQDRGWYVTALVRDPARAGATGERGAVRSVGSRERRRQGAR